MGKTQATTNDNNEWVHRGFTVSEIVDDILEHLGVIIVAEAGHGKSYTAFTLVKEAMKRNNVTVLVFSPSTVWRRKFGAITCVKVGTRDFNPVRPKEQVELYQTNLRDTVWINLDKKWCFQRSQWLKDLLDSKQHLLFEIKYKNGRRIKFFEAEVLKYIYAKQERSLDINPNYRHHYIIVFEELQNAFGTYSMNSDDSLELMTVFTQSRTDANIHYIGIGQRLNDISTKIVERLRPLIGLTIGERSLRKIRSQLPKHLRQTVQQLPKRHWIYLDGKTNPVVEIPIYHKEGKVTYLKPKKEKPRTEPQKKGIVERIMTKLFGEVKIPEYKGDTEESEEEREFWEEEQAFDEMQEEEWEEGF